MARLRLLIAPDKFKGSLTAAEAAAAMSRGAQRAALAAGAEVEIDICPVSDGGEGFLDALAARAPDLRSAKVRGPLGAKVRADYRVRDVDGKAARTAFIEMSAAAGLHLVPPDSRDPERASTFGLGQLIAQALDAGCARIVVGLGGSATCDGGIGMAAALGAAFLDRAASRIESPTGADLSRIARIDLAGMDERLKRTRLIAAADVDNPLFGPDGAARVYAPQKGASAAQVARLDAGLKRHADLARGAGAQADPAQPGCGAAGGLGFGLAAFCGATIARGAEYVLESLRFDKRAAAADLVLTGEGRFDATSLSGKACMAVGLAAARAGARVMALVGATGAGFERALRDRGGPFAEIVAVSPPGAGAGERERMARAAEWLEEAAERVVEEAIGSRQ